MSKGSAPRNCFSKQFRDNYDRIFRKPSNTLAKERHDLIESELERVRKQLKEEYYKDVIDTINQTIEGNKDK